ncbi:hypothetical protein Mgra_00004806 [Meloidogyne graminicola]|uniref:Uncharacterized protein n=1 Tax=Meloidogyne graminicola TaxID=189291 RepID=A0A8S9ZR53_9BILA|nr:hypothetical protein Mgra_00004806 [Meloidogyne graminicola]
MENIQKWVPNTDGIPKTLTLKNPLKNLTSISLSINGVMCTASTSQPVNCNINGDSNDGELIFKINGGKITVIVPFKNASFFSNNKCEIEIGDYDVNTHKLNIKINGANFVIIQNSVTETIACKRGN